MATSLLGIPSSDVFGIKDYTDPGKTKKKEADASTIANAVQRFITSRYYAEKLKDFEPHARKRIAKELMNAATVDPQVKRLGSRSGKRLKEILQGIISMQASRAPQIWGKSAEESTEEAKAQLAENIPDWQTVVGASLAFDTKIGVVYGIGSSRDTPRAAQTNEGSELGGFAFIEGMTDLTRQIEFGLALKSGQIPLMAQIAAGEPGDQGEEGKGSQAASKKKAREQARASEERLLTGEGSAPDMY